MLLYAARMVLFLVHVVRKRVHFSNGPLFQVILLVYRSLVLLRSALVKLLKPLPSPLSAL